VHVGGAPCDGDREHHPEQDQNDRFIADMGDDFTTEFKELEGTARGALRARGEWASRTCGPSRGGRRVRA
jgi:hypothetical protein